jgi:transposase-like protein
VTPVADAAAFLLDFPAWLGNLRRRDRDLIKFLSLGTSPRETARRFRVSHARISQLRGVLRSSWQEFQGEEAQPHC